MSENVCMGDGIVEPFAVLAAITLAVLVGAAITAPAWLGGQSWRTAIAVCAFSLTFTFLVVILVLGLARCWR